ncbi:MAG: type II toxin-antitoxin system RelE/ParE family toxin [Pirellulales bacterium]
MSEPFFSPAAREDLREFLLHVARDKPGAAKRLVDKLEQECRFLANNPGTGTLRADLLANLRMWSVGSYVICFQPSSDGVEIIRVIHGARDIAAIFDH